MFSRKAHGSSITPMNHGSFMKARVLVVFLSLSTACGSSSFSGNSGRRTATSPQSGDAIGSSQGSGHDAVFGGHGEAQLPTDCGDQNVLILDFKSGWWEGDGGNTFREIILDEIKSHACPGSLAGVEYHHIVQHNIPARFHDGDFTQYTQVWILSGSLADAADIPLETPQFLGLLDAIIAHKPRLFLGAGFGSVDHVNEVTKRIWGRDGFHADHKTGEIVTVNRNGSNVRVRSHISPDVSGNLFEGVHGAIVDHVEVGGIYAGTDELLSDLPGLATLATCMTPPVIADDDIFRSPRSVPQRVVGCIGIGSYDGFAFVADAGLQRFYGLYTGEEATKTYLRNIFRALSL